MSTAKKLGVGFGTLVGLMVLLALLMLQRLSGLQAAIGQITTANAPIARTIDLIRVMMLVLLAGAVLIGIPATVILVLLARRGIIERQQAEAALDETAARKLAILQAALDGIVTMNHEGKIIEFNPAAETIFGYSRANALGRPLADLIVPPALRDKHRDGLKRYLATGEGRVLDQRLELSALHANGKEFPVEVSITRLPTSGPPVFTGFVRDITELKAAEAERSRLMTLERETRQQAEIANRTKDEFLATVSHELRTPLQAMIGWTQILRERKLDEAKTVKALETIDRNAKVQAELIEDLLDVSRIISGNLRLDVSSVVLREVIGEAIETVQHAAKAKEIRLVSEWDRDLGPVTGDAGRLRQVVWNLVSNAIKFTPVRGQVTVRLRRVASQAEIVVSDTGRGIKPEFLPLVFERFRQADASAAREHGGLGLGLAIVRHLVELHGGTVAVESPGEGRGATFTVRLPLSNIRATSNASPDAASLPSNWERQSWVERLPSLAGLRILLVEDQLDARELLVTLLERCGAVVTPTASAAEALRAFARVRPDILVSDIGLPREDGYSLIRKIRELDLGNGVKTPAIALTAYTNIEDRLRALSEGFQAHVAKPVEASELITVIASLVGRLRRLV